MLCISEVSSQTLPFPCSFVLQFWAEVFKYKDGAGVQIFQDLAIDVLRFLSLPISNAAVERVFSIMNCVKTKTRNKLKLDTLQAIIITKIYCFNRKICCKHFSPLDKMLLLFNNNIYNNNDDNDHEEENFENTLDAINDTGLDNESLY